ncbi:hypothetical protein GLOTRDRAFT_112899 [Gloeophyllum trabeum ATCC 11539]|uniref:Uncharacterized protein n=1 Tax=Gloeophyllum trabeum (strain ATCC 11539 / FP-39264 / Madison 617) TaxID=670483 RepID=S7RYX5_GLOTA|nr:uncharacterized protein GLOTRDRAFT_112899 [Gloeophyllum trabeum ATCC 11539]EPQ60165.1 hypothetical protein GLOTRDRAFT_112899 [Gloeophyllum trabeum ATCC 11539]
MALSSDTNSLLLVLFIFSLLLFCAIGWCILSSCMGKPVLDFFSEVWRAAVSPARDGREGYRPMRRTGRADGEMWEMEYRSRLG